MTLKDDFTDAVRKFSVERWGDIPRAFVVPSTDALSFGNNGAHMDVTVLYADITDSTKMVDSLVDWRAAEYYKAFLHCASQLIRANGGEIEAFDGDRVMAIFVGNNQADMAVRAALQLNDAVRAIINPTFAGVYNVNHWPIKFTVGIDSGQCLVVKTGVRSVGELAWIGSAANHAAKLNSFDGLDHEYPIRITEQTRAKLSRTYLIDSSGAALWQGPYGNLKSRNHYRTRHFLTIG
jgi:class 3 adenylate cyclase